MNKSKCECTSNRKGYHIGDVCNRKECNGIIQQREVVITCECIVNPACGDCIDPIYYCPKCGWEE